MSRKAGYFRNRPFIDNLTNNYAPDHFLWNAWQEYLKTNPQEADHYLFRFALGIPLKEMKNAVGSRFIKKRLSFKNVLRVLDKAVPHVTLEDLIGVKSKARSQLPKRKTGYSDKLVFGILFRQLLQKNFGAGLLAPDVLRLSMTTGINYHSLHDYLSCRANPDLHNLTLILSAFKISLSELLDGEFRRDMVAASLQKPAPRPFFVPRGLAKEPAIPDIGYDLYLTEFEANRLKYSRPLTEETRQKYIEEVEEFSIEDF